MTICANSGVIATNQGSTQTYTGLLTKSMVLDAKQTKGMSSEANDRLVGGKLLNRGLRKSIKDFVSSKIGGVMSGVSQSKMSSFCKKKNMFLKQNSTCKICHLTVLAFVPLPTQRSDKSFRI